MGNLREWRTTVRKFASLPQAEIAPEEAFLDFVAERQLAGRGIGFVDAHLLLTCQSHRLQLWTRDRRLVKEAEKLALAFPD